MSLLDTASLIVTPNGYKEGKLYSVIPSDGSGDMSVSRATTATRVNSAGLVELVPYNLLQRSEQFDNAYWQKLNGGIGSIPTVTANTATAPDGTLTADRIQLSLNGGTSGSDLSYINTSVSTTAATFSIYAKSNTTPCTIYFRSGSTVTTINITTEWQRFELYSSGAITVAQFGLRGGSYGGAVNSNTADISVWGAQLNEGSTALPYQKTETRLNIPRLDYSNGTCPSLLVEPQRTNLARYSSSFDNVAWTKGAVSVTANNAISPSGVQDSDLVTANGANTQHYVFQPSSAGAKTYSVFAKMGTQRYIQILTSGTAAPVANFDLQDGVANMSGSNSTATIEDFGNGWWRCILQTNDSLAGTFYINYANSLTMGRFGATISSGTLYLWGAQAEVGRYPTSLIPTQAATVTRNADVISKTGISSLINSEEGVLYAEIKGFISLDTIEPNRYITLTNGTSNERVALLLGGNVNQLRAIIYSSTQSINLSFTTSLTDVKQYNKLAVKYKSGDYAFFLNGVKIGGSIITNAFPANTLTDLSFNIGGGTQPFRGYAKDVIVYNTALTDAELATLTTI